jgi:hypothetical protein
MSKKSEFQTSWGELAVLSASNPPSSSLRAFEPYRGEKGDRRRNLRAAALARVGVREKG